MSQEIVFATRLFTGSTPDEIASGDRKLRALLGALVLIDLEWLRTHPKTPALYSAGVRYRREPSDSEVWCDIPTILASGRGDCEDLACWRTAEVRFRRGIKVKAEPQGRRSKDGTLHYHIVVRWPDGLVEDPSARLGMGGPDDR